MPPSPSHAPLNVFQKVILQWERVHPYNGAQILTLTQTPDQRELESAWTDALYAMGLGQLHLESDAYHYNGPIRAHSVAVVHPRDALDAYLTAELNRPFADGVPFRPFVRRHAPADGASSTSCDLGVVYRHLAADSVSVRMLLREWFVRLFDPDRRRCHPPRHPRHGYWSYVGPSRGRWDVGGAILAAPRTFSRFRKARRLHTGGSTDFRTAFLHRQAPAGLPSALRAAAAARGVTVHDLFLAAAARACADHLPFRNVRRRTHLAVGSIVDLRPYSTADLSDTFGLFLGFSNVFCSPADLRRPDRLVHSISAQTRRHKAAHTPAAGIVWMYASLASRRLVGDEQAAYAFYRKHMPLAGGVSNVCLDRTFAADYHPAPLAGYTRVSPTGPMIPVAFTPTTLRDHFTLGLSHRSSVVPAPAAEALAGEFLDQLTRLI